MHGYFLLRKIQELFWCHFANKMQSPIDSTLGPKIDQILIYPYPYPYLFYLSNTNMDTDINRMKNLCPYLFKWTRLYKSDTKNIDINMNISWIIKFYDHRIKDIIKWAINEVNVAIYFL